jgi:predicted RNA-binding Zn ribbon-like protein
MRSRRKLAVLLSVVGLAAAMASPPLAAQDAQATADEVEILRETMSNLLRALVARGVLQDADAKALVRNARSAAEQTAEAKAAVEAEEMDAVRVTYVPEIVREELSEQIREDIADDVVADVVEVAKRDRWGVPAAMPEWLSRLRWYGDVRLRSQLDAFDDANEPNIYRNFQAINNAGGEGLAGIDAFLNTTVDRFRTRLRARVGLAARLTDNVEAGIQVTAGNDENILSIQDDMEMGDGRPRAAIDLAWMRFSTVNDRRGVPRLTVVGGRFENPFLNTLLVWDPDLRFEGVSARYRQPFSGAGDTERSLFLTAGAFPLEEFDRTSNDKWLYSAQLGADLRFGPASRLRIAAAYHDFSNVVGRRNALNSQEFDYTAPAWLQRGNTLFDIRNDTDPATNLFALASEFELINYTFAWEYSGFGDIVLRLAGDYVDNIGFDQADVLARTGQVVDPRTVGYQIDFSVGRAAIRRRHDWRLYATYKRLERDAIIDGFAESNFLLGGTDAQGYVLTADYGLSKATWLRARLLSANEIDGPPLGVDTLQLDINARF